MKITMKITTTAITRLTPVLMALMIPNEPTIDLRKSADLSSQVQIFSCTPYCIRTRRMASSFPVVSVRTRTAFAGSASPSMDAASRRVMKTALSTLEVPALRIPFTRNGRVTPFGRVRSTVRPTTTPPSVGVLSSPGVPVPARVSPTRISPVSAGLR